ncbi:MAG: preprotein translocase subunit YajC [Planctomycetota bacterium]|nr:preprotein translocase subunit YajC [Planctomycetota bacterium]
MLLHLHNALALIQDTSTTPEEVSQPSMLFPMLAMGAIFYFVLIAPERKTRKTRKAMLETVKKGDKVMTTGGIFGTVRKVEEHKIHLMIDDKVCMVFTRSAVQGIVDAEGVLLDDKTAPAKEVKAVTEKGKKEEASPKVVQEK